MDWNLTHTKNGAGKRLVVYSKLKLWTLFWDQGEHEWPLGLMYSWNVYCTIHTI